MLAKANRIVKESNFKKLARTGKVVRGRFFTLKFLYLNNKTSRFGIVISTQVSKKAVIRNKLKRQLSEIFRPLINNMFPVVEVMAVVKPEIVNQSFSEIKKELLLCLIKANILKSK